MRLLRQGIIKLPVITIGADAIDPGQRRAQVRLCVRFQMFDDASVVAAEILNKPVVDARHHQTAILDLRTAGMIDEIARRSFEQVIGVCAGKRLSLQVRATERCSVYGVMDAGIPPYRTQNAVFDVIQCHGLAFNGYEFEFPWPE